MEDLTLVILSPREGADPVFYTEDKDFIGLVLRLASRRLRLTAEGRARRPSLRVVRGEAERDDS